MLEEEFDRLRDTAERMMALYKAGDGPGLKLNWEGLTHRDQRIVVSGLIFTNVGPPNETAAGPEHFVDEAVIGPPDGFEDPEYARVAQTSEAMIRQHRDGDAAAWNESWEDLTCREQRMVMASLMALVTAYRLDLGHPPDAIYGPE